MKINLISFVKLFPDYQKIQLVLNSRTENLTVRLLAEHATDIVSSVTVSASSSDSYLLVTVTEGDGSFCIPPSSIHI